MTNFSQKTEQDFSENIFKSFNDIFFNPEIERREKSNEIQPDFQLIAAQVIFFPNGEKPIIRLNNEVKATVKVKNGVNTNDNNYWASSEDVEKIIFDDKEFQDCGHATMILFTDGYQLSFDFRYNIETCKKHLQIAEQFLATAEYSYNNKYFSAFIDNSFSTIELLAKSKLLLAINKNMYGKTNHNAIKTEFSKYHMNIPEEFEMEEKNLLNRLSKLRSNARYLNGEFDYTTIDLENILKTLKKMYNQLIIKIS